MTTPIDLERLHSIGLYGPSDDELLDDLERACRSCGCTEDDACFDVATGPCYFVELDLCSSCAA